MIRFDSTQLVKFFDHTILKSDTQKDEVKKVCFEAIKYGFCTVFINPCWVEYAASILQGTSVKVGVPIGFPLGAVTTKVKAFEANDAIKNGAEELDVVLNIGRLKDGDYEWVKKDIVEVVKASQGRICKVIIETQLLTKNEKINACHLVKEAGASFVKSNTGLFEGIATVEDIQLMRHVVGTEMGVKASGGIRTLKDALLFIEAGANRLGCSKSVDIIEELKRDKSA